MKERVALFGGAFDPVHTGHIEIARMIVRDFFIDKFYFIPSNNPPHKKPHMASKKDRLKMLMIATLPLGEKFIISDYELKKNEMSYTIDTVEHFKDKYPNDELYFIAGSDIFGSIRTWHRYRDIFKHTKFIIVLRANFDFYAMADEIGDFFFDHLNKGEIILYDESIADVSSTEIRMEHKFKFAPKAVRDYITKNRLYIEG